MDDSSEKARRVVVATAEHAGAISRVYHSVLIDPQILLDLASSSSKRSVAARQSIQSHGGFLSPPGEKDMQMALHHGLVMVYMQDGEVLGFNRYVTQPEKVHHAFFSEFRLDPSQDYSETASFRDWSGSRKLDDTRTLTSIRWVDRSQALIAMQAAQAGLQNKPEGRLAWAIDSAVHPDHQHLGIGKTLSHGMRQAVRPRIACLAYRMFKISKINNIDLIVKNDPSKRAFVDSSSRLFACSEEKIRIRNDISLTVCWNHWLKHYQP